MTRTEIEQNTIALLRTAVGTRPDLRVVEIDGQRSVVKDFRRSDPLFRLIVGPILISRERGALVRLNGLCGVPQLIQRIDRHAIAIEHVDGVALRDFKGPIPEEFFDRLADVLHEIHSRGVAHCDLRSSGNVIFGSNGEPKVVDFAACVIRGRGWNPIINFLFRQFAQTDDHAVLLLKRKHAPHLLRPDEQSRLASPLPYEKLAKWFGNGVRNITKRLLTRGNKE